MALQNNTKYINHTYLMHFSTKPWIQNCCIHKSSAKSLPKLLPCTNFVPYPKPDENWPKMFSGHTLVYWPLFQFKILPFPDLISVSRFFPYRTYKRTFLRSKTVRYTVVFTQLDFQSNDRKNRMMKKSRIKKKVI